ncbi:hypothetical protein EON81_11690 [bacterium]|nr:MAG: hypothetical protein EON81_11690 [bacterium]
MRHFRKSGLGLFATILLAGCAGDGESGGNPPLAPVFGSSEAGLVDGPAPTARFSNPVNVAVAPNGTVYVADFDNDAVRAIDTAGNVSTVIRQDGFSRPFGMTVANDGTLYVQTDANDSGDRDITTGTVWKHTPGGGAATVVARNLGRPRALLALDDGRILMANLSDNTIAILNPRTSAVTLVAGQAGEGAFADGTGTGARFNRPYGLAKMPDGSFVVADQNNHRIRRFTLSGVVTTYAGTGGAGSVNGSLSTATFNLPQDVEVTANGTVYVADQGNHVIRRIGSNVTTFVGDGTAGFAEGIGTAARFYGLEGIGLSPNGRRLWIADGNGGDGNDYNRVRFQDVN